MNVILKIKYAKDVEIADLNGLSDPYVKFQIEN